MDDLRIRIPVWLVSFLLLAPSVGADPEAVSTLPNLGSAIVRARTAALLVSDLRGGELPARAAALVWAGEAAAEEGGERTGERPGSPPAAILLTVLELDGESLLGDEPGEDGVQDGVEDLSDTASDTVSPSQLEIFLYLLDDHDQVILTESLSTVVGEDAFRAFQARRDARSEPAAEAAVSPLPGRAGVRLRAALPVTPGEYRLRYLARLEDGPFGLGEVAVTVPEALERSRPPSFVPAPVGVWIDVEPPTGPWPLDSARTPAAEPVAEGEPLWVDRLRDRDGEATPRRRPAQPTAALPVTEVEDGLRAVLERWVTDGVAEAAGLLVEVETGAVPVADTAALDDLAAAETQWTESLLADLPEARWSLVRLYRETGVAHRRFGQGALAAHALDRAVALAQGSDDSQAAAVALAGLAGDLRRAGRVREARGLLEASLAHRDVVTTRLALAALAERLGDPRRVEELLEPVAAQRPPADESDLRAHQESLLRLALSHRRLGEERRAEALLDLLVHSAVVEPWLRQVALQEQVGLWLERGRCGPAERTLEHVLDLEPLQAQWRVLLIRAQRCREAHGAARELAVDTLAGEVTRRGAWEPSPRGRYGQFPDRALEAAGRTLDRWAEEGRAALTAWWREHNGDDSLRGSGLP